MNFGGTQSWVLGGHKILCDLQLFHFFCILIRCYLSLPRRCFAHERSRFLQFTSDSGICLLFHAWHQHMNRDRQLFLAAFLHLWPFIFMFSGLEIIGPCSFNLFQSNCLRLSLIRLFYFLVFLLLFIEKWGVGKALDINGNPNACN